MKHRISALFPFLLTVVLVCSSFQSRDVLGLAVEACKINAGLTGSPFPCMKVVQGAAPLQAYAILREPTDKERTVLVPLADVPGIEDPRLLSADAPNYFAAAWRERRTALSLRAEANGKTEFALAINAVSSRTQDRLHVHIGCVTQRFRAVLKSHELDISSAKFDRIRNNGDWWTRFIAADDLTAINPMKLVASSVEGASHQMKDMTIGVVSSTLRDGRRGFFILARMNQGGKKASAEQMINPQCD